MEFRRISQSLDKVKEKESCSLKDILGLIADLNNDVRKEMKVGSENLPIADEDEKEVMSSLTNFALLIKRIYSNKKYLFTDEQSTARFEKTRRTLEELKEKADQIDEECKLLNTKKQEIEDENQRISNLLKDQKENEDLLEQEKKQQELLRKKQEEIDKLQKQIETIETITIPGVEKQITDLKEFRIPQINESLRRIEQKKQDLQRIFDKKDEEYESELVNQEALEKQIKEKEEKILQKVQEQEQLTTQAKELRENQELAIKDLREEERICTSQSEKYRETIEELNAEIGMLKSEQDVNQKKIDELTVDKQKEKDLVIRLESVRVRLQSELNILKSRSGETQGENKDLQDQIDNYNEKKSNVKKSRDALESQLKEIESKISKIKEENEKLEKDRRDLEKEMTSLKQDLKNNQDSYDLYKRQVQNQKAEFQRMKIYAASMLRNKKEQTKDFEEQQTHFGEKIKNLIGDNEVLLYADTTQIKAMKEKLDDYQRNMNKELIEALKTYQELLQLMESSMENRSEGSK